ncbi:LEM3 (ligand-effect modulator 3) / CDC50 family protein [Candida albicans]|uniref:LEM3 (Ligand-effect modulator 3) / CDC50 family protein n=1 Tax=Candida albicans TaxID=5476 RepID=A0A8H6F156_CANAX|nr:LEM3 (ligand-effect modulator 3) / CDC50 family protein [Candida albicans]
MSRTADDAQQIDNGDQQREGVLDEYAQEGEYESSSDYDDESFVDKKEKSRRPKENSFTQQRLKAINPVLTAKTVIPLLVAIAIVFVPLGAAMWYASHKIEDITIDYSQCQNLARNIDTNSESKPKFSWKLQMTHRNNLMMKSPIYLYYRLHNFYANHRRYVKSFSEDQLNGKPATLNTIKNTVGQNCQPLSDVNGKRIYPCGLIANSLFNDTFTEAFEAVNGTSSDNTLVLTDKGIAWSTDKNRFKKTQYNYTEVVPPPNWYKKFPNGYNETNIPDISPGTNFKIGCALSL